MVKISLFLRDDYMTCMTKILFFMNTLTCSAWQTPMVSSKFKRHWVVFIIYIGSSYRCNKYFVTHGQDIIEFLRQSGMHQIFVKSFDLTRGLLLPFYLYSLHVSGSRLCRPPRLLSVYNSMERKIFKKSPHWLNGMVPETHLPKHYTETFPHCNMINVLLSFDEYGISCNRHCSLKECWPSITKPGHEFWTE